MNREQHLIVLAEAGGLCHVCGGVHAARIDAALLASAANLPTCDCDACELCGGLREQLAALANADVPHVETDYDD